MPPKSNKNYKGRSSNVLRYIESYGNEGDIGSLLASNLAAGARLAAENESQAHDEKTSRTYELRLMSLEKFAEENGDDAVLFGPNKRPFLAATIQTYMRKFCLIYRFVMYCTLKDCEKCCQVLDALCNERLNTRRLLTCLKVARTQIDFYNGKA